MTTLLRRRLLVPIFILCFASLCIAGEELWTEVRSPNFVVISNASIKQARRTAKLLEQYRLLIKTVMKDSKVDPAIPLTIFAAKDERTFNTLLAEEQRERGATKKAGMFLPGQERSLVAIRLDASEDSAYHTIYHEYFHLITNLNYGNLPLWLSEGLAEFFAYSELSDNLAFLGKVQPGVIEEVRSKPLILLPVFFSVKRDSPYYRHQDETSIFYRQAWAFAHYLMIGDRRAHSKQLMDFIGLIRNGTSEEDAVTRTFGDLTQLEAALARYIQLPTTAYFEVPAKLSIQEDQYVARTLSPAESLGLRGELLTFYGKTDRAKTILEQALAIDPKNARTNEAMGMLFSKLNNPEQAGKYFLAAADSDSKSFLANFYAAQAINLQKGDSDAAEKYLRQAIAINPEFAPAYAELSRLLRQKSNLADALVYGKKAESLQPGVLAHKINVASIMAQMDQIDEAYEYGRFIASIAREENDRQSAESFMNWIQKVRDQKLQIKRMQEENNARMKQRNEAQAKLVARNRLSEDEANEKPREESGDSENKRKEEITRLSSAERGPTVKINGIIKSVKCDAPTIMEIALDAKGTFKKLYSDNYFKIGYRSLGVFLKKDFQPCHDLEGESVEVEYQIISSSYFSGSIKSITVQKR